MEKEITIQVKEKKERTLYLTQHFGEGSFGKTKFKASFTLPNMSLIVDIEKKRYIVSNQDIIESVVKLHEKNN